MTAASHPMTTRWQAGEPAVLSTAMIPSTLVAETLQRSGVDGVLFDMQHGHIDVQSLVGLCQTVGNLGGTPFVRVPSADPWIVMKALDAGAFGIICPLVNVRAEAEALVDACFYPPLGGRSNGPTRPWAYGPTDDFHGTANDTILPFVMIETVEGMSNLDDIFSVPHLAGVVIGPSDLAGTHGLGFQFDSRDEAVLANYRTVLDAAGRHGLRAGIFTADPGYSREMIDLGFDFVLQGGDLGTIGAVTAAGATAFRTGGATGATAAGPYSR
ncbi:HpcH/HpaI aldolase/citrate lyase family protein [Schumannella sp. 10F1B-5-1]|uniref:HpcH/HpaI aldolase family protein n=1 Tax=Schumannella sp. 10F1B-5-1 TaxID=2590780 RepID=UPI0011318067|nr:aldolase/citrate lyase family protein [Schumannella sp. 10F1B-5-1]TPW78308.1 2,4-dihydroxyhept-2-ene-1,7-dioic acid aldolase [Schumannella sp. 10F1B-5-1]